MDIEEAKKRVKELKPPENYMLIKFSYDCKILLPYADGVQVIAALKSAEKYESSYSRPKITPWDNDQSTFSIISKKECNQIRMAQLLDIDINTLKESENQQ